MDVAGVLLALLTALSLQDSPDRRVNVANASFIEGPNWRSKTVEKARDGDEVTVLGVEGKYSKVQVKRNNLTAWIESALLVPPAKFIRKDTDEKEGEKLAGQNAEAKRGINQPMEDEYRSQGGPEREASYVALDALLARRLVTQDRDKLVARMKEFQQEGKLGEHSPVK